MPRPKAEFPAYSLHKPSGQACVYVNRNRVYLGKYGSGESKRAYREVLDQLAAGGELTRAKSASPAAPQALTLNELFVRFVAKESPRYSRSEQYCFQTAIRVVRELFGNTSVSDFGPLKLQLVREAMVKGDAASGRKPWCRNTSNRQSKRIRQIFRWGVSQELVPVDVLARLATVRALAIGETTAADYAPREAVPQADVDPVREQLKPLYRDVLDLMLLTGARPGELLKLTGGMLQRRSDCWLAELNEHKTARKGKRRFLVFNVAAQGILLRHIKADLSEPLFACRRDNFGTAVKRACKRAGVTPFVPHQLRHTTAARLVDAVGLEATQATLGHSDSAMTLHYARSAERAATAAVQKLG